MSGATERWRNTVRKYRNALEAAGFLDGSPDEIPTLEELKATITEQIPATEPPQQTSSIEAFKSDIERMLAKNAGPKAIYDCLELENSDFEGSLSAVKRMCLRPDSKGLRVCDGLVL